MSAHGKTAVAASMKQPPWNLFSESIRAHASPLQEHLWSLGLGNLCSKQLNLELLKWRAKSYKGRPWL